MKIPPNNREAEKSVLGAILLENNSLRKIMTSITTLDFYQSPHQIIFKAIMGMFIMGEKIDLVTLSENLQTSGNLKIIGGAQYLMDLMEATPTATTIVHYAKIVKEKSNLRKIYKQAQETCDEIERKKPDELLEGFADIIKTVRGDSTEKEIFKAEEEKERIIEIYENGGLKKGIVPGNWKNLGRFYSIRKGLFTVITGAPGSGKTNLLDCMSVDLAEREGWKIAVFSPEYYPLSIHIVNLMEKSSGFSMNEKSENRMTEDAMGYSLTFIDDHFTFIKPNKSPKIDHILSIASLIKEKNGLDALIIDPYNMCDHSRDPKINENTYVGGFLRSIRDFSRDNDCHTFLVAHPRKLQKRKDGNFEPPSAYDICGSSEFFNMPDFVLSIWRNMIDKDKPVQVFIQKVKHKELGTVGKALLKYLPENGNYEDSWEY